jgi:hypothetical protein
VDKLPFMQVAGYDVQQLEIVMQVQFRAVTYPGIFFGGRLCQEFFSQGVQQIQLRTEGRENEDLGAVAP